MITGSSLFGIDITKGVIDDDSLEVSVVPQRDVEIERDVDDFTAEVNDTVEFVDDDQHILPEKSNDVRRNLMYETDNIVDDLHRNGRERNL